MRHRTILMAVPMMLMLCLLCACGGKANDPLQAPMDFRGTLLAKGGCAFELEALAETGDQLWPLTLACELDADGDGSVTILAPESIAGIRAELRDGAGSLRYENVCLGLGTLPGTELAPASAPGRLVRAWARDWLASAGAEDGALLACYEEEPILVRTWFDGEGIPVRAELAVEGVVRFTAEIRNFEWKAGKTNETAKEDLG
ncbi:MAG: hypothetical protein IKQ54_11140 [Oscillospiraceae bacterium]|nr:hypothetical protein [Oscillospiraceae bacterium]MBR4194867.1 hypothetical protein [Oscillospiraceae bacterium]